MVAENDSAKEFGARADVAMIAEGRNAGWTPAQASAWMNAAMSADAAFLIDHDGAPVSDAQAGPEDVGRNGEAEPDGMDAKTPLRHQLHEIRKRSAIAVDDELGSPQVALKVDDRESYPVEQTPFFDSVGGQVFGEITFKFFSGMNDGPLEGIHGRILSILDLDPVRWVYLTACLLMFVDYAWLEGGDGCRSAIAFAATRPIPRKMARRGQRSSMSGKKISPVRLFSGR